MWTGVCWPNDIPVSGDTSYNWMQGDETEVYNRKYWVEGPSYCVRLIVFDINEVEGANGPVMPDD